MRNAAVAPIVAPIETKIVPRTTPKRTPAPIVMIDPGTKSTHAAMYAAMKTRGAIAPSDEIHSRRRWSISPIPSHRAAASKAKSATSAAAVFSPPLIDASLPQREAGGSSCYHGACSAKVLAVLEACGGMSAGTGHAYNEACDVVNLEIWL